MSRADPQFAADLMVYRALTRLDHINPTTKEALPDAFIRRESGDEDGLSLSRDQNPGVKFRGLVSLTVGQIEQLGLKVKPDPDNPAKVLVDGLPLRSQDAGKAEFLGGELAKLSKPV